MDSELKLYQQIQTKLRKHPRDVQVRTLEWVAKKLYEEFELPKVTEGPLPPAPPQD